MFLKSKFPDHHDWRTQLRVHKWHNGKMNSRFDHRRLSMVLQENLVAARRNCPIASAQHNRFGHMSNMEINPMDTQYRYIKRTNEATKIEFHYSDDLGRIT